MGLQSHKKRMKTLTVDNKIIARRITTVELQQNVMHASIMYIVIHVAVIFINDHVTVIQTLIGDI